MAARITSREVTVLSDAEPPASRGYAPQSVVWRLMISAYVLFHIVGTVVWNAPASYVDSKLHPIFYRYMTYAGFDQNWGMFAPEPGHENFYMVARITYSNGRTTDWPVGRMDTVGNFERLIRERERKMVEQLYNTQQGNPYYPGIALWAARRNATDPNNPPVKVEIMRFWSPIPPPPDGVDKAPVTTWHNDVIYSTTINANSPRSPGSARR